MNTREHVLALVDALAGLDADLARIEDWGRHLARVLPAGGRLLAVGNGGSAAQASHLTAELVGRYQEDREPFSAIALHAETAALTAIANDYPPSELFARQLRAHARRGDVLVALSTSGRSANVLAAVAAARAAGVTAWGLTGPFPNPLAGEVDDAVCVRAAATPTIQEVHQVVVHLLCEAFDAALGAGRPLAGAGSEVRR